MFEQIINFFKGIGKKQEKEAQETSKDKAKERLHLVLMQDRANVSADFLELMKQEIIDVIKKYIDIDEKEIDVRLTNQENDDGTTGAPALYANIPILNIKNDARKIDKKDIEENKEKDADKKEKTVENKKEDKEQQDKVDEDSTNISFEEELLKDDEEENENQEEQEENIIINSDINEDCETSEEKVESE